MEILESLSNNLARLRKARGLTISGLAQGCGIAKSTLSSLESGQGNPTIETLWAIANALDTPFGSLLAGKPGEHAGWGDEKTSIRFIERAPSENGACIETYALSIEQGHTKASAAHPPGVREKVVVTSGPMLVGDMRAPKRVNSGEVHAFAADVPHLYGALNSAAQAMVFVEYPAARLQDSEWLTLLDWPANEAAWDGARSIVERMCIDVANGIALRMLRLRGCTQPCGIALKMLRATLPDLRAGGFRWPVLSLTEIDQDGLFLAVLPQRFARAFHGASDEPDETPLARRALGLARAAESALCPWEESPSMDAETQASWTLEALLCECALRDGRLRLPSQFQPMTRHSQGVTGSSEKEAFSSRMQLEHPAAFELLHPAYARQVVAMAQDITSFVPDARRAPLHALDVATGRAVHLLMLQELLPGLRPLAVQPDPVIYAHLEANGRDRGGITLHPGGFLELDHPDGQTRLITAVGASHQFNGAFMLQKAMRLLQPGGVLSVADEFLPPFHDIESRQLALLRHHAAYILAAASMIECSGQEVPDDAQGKLYRAFRSQFVQAVLHAQQGQVWQAVGLCRQLHARVRQADLDKNCGHAIAAYTGFFRLKLQALVADFDDETEHKTHVRRFLELATATGFELLRQRRVFASHGWDEHDGGTHVITLRRPSP